MKKHSRPRSTEPSARQLRVGEEVRHGLARIFERHEMSDPALMDVTLTVTEVRMSPDLKHATAFVMPLAGAFSRPAASARLEITSAISAGKSAGLAARIRAAMFDPRPEIRIATRRFMVPPPDWISP